MSLIERARFLASGQNDPHSVTIEELCAELEANAAEIGRKDAALEKCFTLACDYSLHEKQARSEIANIANAALNKAEQLGLDDESPSQAKANAIARTLEAATDEAAVDAASAEFEKHRSALDETQQMALEVAVSKARERAKGKAKEGVE